MTSMAASTTMCPRRNCLKDGFTATPDQTGVPGLTFEFDRLGVRVPAILISPWVPKATVVPGPDEPDGRTFEHASIPNTVTEFFVGRLPGGNRAGEGFG